MPRITGNWKSQDKTNWIILDKLVRNGSHNLPSIEKGREKLSHASVRKGIQYLQKRNLVSEIAVDTTIPKKPIKTFDATLLGLLVWLVKKISDNKNPHTIISPKYFKGILPIISKKWNTLTKYYDKKHMEKILAKIFSNIEILADDPFIVKYKTFYRGVTMEFKNTQEHKIFHNVLELVDSNEFKKGFETMINFAFFLELYKLYKVGYYEHDEKVGFSKKPDIKDWLNIINSDRKLKNQIHIGFSTMKEFSEITDRGLEDDLNVILGKENEYLKSHNYVGKKLTKLELKEYIGKIINNDLDTWHLLSRTNYEYELEFHRKNVFKADRFFKV